MLIGLVIILLLILTLPFLVKKVENNMELFLLVMGLLATICSGVINNSLIVGILKNHLLYMITAAVLFSGILFKILQGRIKRVLDIVLRFIPLKVFIFLMVIALGLMSSMITAIVAALVLVEIISNLPMRRSDKIRTVVVACFAIGLGAVLTPIGEPLSTIVVSRLEQDFWYLAEEMGMLIIPGIVAMGLLGGIMIRRGTPEIDDDVHHQETESYSEILLRSAKVFVFILALEFLGAGFKPVIDKYLIHLDSKVLYPINMLSAVLDNATLAAAEISHKMNSTQIGAILMGLLISGGMLIPGNIPNIISANKLKISSQEWAWHGMPLGLVMIAIYYLVLFVI
ncbi:MAG TPA: DUF1646 family protein [Syntrophomonadaceae bacterium]|nr:DUF1646 family protein [Syntrophomonadaceae bacterium]